MKIHVDITNLEISNSELLEIIAFRLGIKKDKWHIEGNTVYEYDDYDKPYEVVRTTTNHDAFEALKAYKTVETMLLGKDKTT